MIGRRVGSRRRAVSTRCSVGSRGSVYEELRDEAVRLEHCFDTATELCLSGVAVEEDIRSSNVFDVAVDDSSDDIPEEYRPGSPFQQFKRELEITT